MGILVISIIGIWFVNIDRAIVFVALSVIVVALITSQQKKIVIKILGWKPKDSNQKMFRESYDWFKENYNFLVKTGTTHTTKLNRKIFWIIEKL